MMICDLSGDFWTFFNSSILPLSASTAFLTSVVIALVYAISNVISNPKLKVWAKEEVIQLVVSAAVVIVLPLTVSFFCSLDFIDLGEVFVGRTYSEPLDSYNLYGAAEYYVFKAAVYSQNALAAIRYHLFVYTILSSASGFECLLPVCLFSYSGYSLSPFGGYAAIQAALSPFLQISLISQISALMNYFILRLTQTGFLFFFLPLAIFLRFVPYLRVMGSVLFALSISFILIYPFLLAVLSLVVEVFEVPSTYRMREYSFEESSALNIGGEFLAGFASLLSDLTFGDVTDAAEGAKAIYFGDGSPDSLPKEDPAEAILFVVKAFFASSIILNLALLSAMASTVYITRFFGETVDLSRLTQLV